ncbi:uncharacterized protein LOC115719863 [Cannabis sativa]|uniref:uncharacterized protein LOC115719863 n=1 Tax=Cannabis sativa TaxID=3483 RepID=UPI0029CA86F0|nr:uncharacterized protein LOC115719863 [Cannabis sativa]
MNGRLQGSFKGEKGCRQGDPISPLIFVLVMDYLTRILNFHPGKVSFGFHPLCKQLKLVNLCFADDLVIFCKGNEKSVRFIHEAFSLFCDTTGLKANMNKSAIYFGGVNEATKRAILNLVNMEEGSFRLKYLGVKLCPTKWKTLDCGCILDKVSSWYFKKILRLRDIINRDALLGVAEGLQALEGLVFEDDEELAGKGDKRCHDCYSVFLMAE